MADWSHPLASLLADDWQRRAALAHEDSWRRYVRDIAGLQGRRRWRRERARACKRSHRATLDRNEFIQAWMHGLGRDLRHESMAALALVFDLSEAGIQRVWLKGTQRFAALPCHRCGRSVTAWTRDSDNDRTCSDCQKHRKAISH